VIWNAAVGYKFLKNKQADLRLYVFDLLRQNRSIQRNVSDNYYEDVQANVLTQYSMLIFTYNIRSFRMQK
jgi:vacuolar-type H+-ATPase subunit D/Vma8